MKENIDMKNFRCIRCINGIKVDLTKIYKTLKIYSIINKEVKGLICNEKLKMQAMKKLENLDEYLKKEMYSLLMTQFTQKIFLKK